MKCRWKAYHIDFQKIYVGGSESVTGESYCTLRRTSLFSNLIFQKNEALLLWKFSTLKHEIQIIFDTLSISMYLGTLIKGNQGNFFVVLPRRYSSLAIFCYFLSFFNFLEVFLICFIQLQDVIVEKYVFRYESSFRIHSQCLEVSKSHACKSFGYPSQRVFFRAFIISNIDLPNFLHLKL